ncbi:MAG: hypothetical protein ACKVP7_00470 [Hyphomicrobiaceae bacterium]
MSQPTAALHPLLTESLRLWRVPARVENKGDSTLRISCLGHDVTIAPAAPDMPFRWMVTTTQAGAPSRQRPALSVVSVLRQVRNALDPTFAGQRLRIAAPPVLPPQPRAGSDAS